MKNDDVFTNCVYASPEAMTSDNDICNDDINTLEYPFNYSEFDSFEHTVRMCTFCGSAVPLDANFCPYCGRKLK